MSISETAQLVWSVSELLRGEYPLSEHGSIVLAFTVLRRFGYMSTPSFDAVLTDPEHVNDRLVDYIKALPHDVRDVMKGFRFEQQLEQLRSRDTLRRVVQAFAAVDLHPDRVTNVEMGDIFDTLIQTVAEQSKESRGEHHTPRDVSWLLVNLLFAGDSDALRTPGVAHTIFDPACGTGGTLSIAEEHIAELIPENEIEVFGQDINSESYTICKASRLVKARQTDNIKLGNSLTDDQHRHLKADYVVSNPPFGLNWSRSELSVRHEYETMGFAGRFGPGLPRKSDSTLLFLLHMLSKMKPLEQGGARLVFLTAGSSLWTGDAESGESNIRRHLIERDMLEGIVALPPGLLPHTAIPSYVWVVTNRKQESRRGHVRLIDGSGFFEPAPQQRGRRRIGAGQINELLRLFTDGTDSPLVRIFQNDDFGYVQVHTEESVQPGTSPPGLKTTVIELPLSSNPETYFRTEILPHRPTAKIKRSSIGYAIQRIAHLGFELSRALATVEQRYRTCKLRPLHQVCLNIQRRSARGSELETTSPDALSTISALREIRIVPDESVVSADYLAMFFSTELGKKLISALSTGTLQPGIYAKDLEKLPIPVPTVGEQRAVLDAKRRIDELATLLRRVEDELAANPENIPEVNQRVVLMLQALGQLSDADEVRELIRGGESKILEFKQTLSLDVRKQSKEGHIEEAILKTIVAFLNSDGGDLLVGVSDGGELLGLGAEIERFHQSNTDKFLLHLKNLLKRIGEQHYPLINQRLVVVADAQVLWVRCAPSKRPVFLDDEVFYVRTNPATDKLTGRKMMEYIKNRFE